MSEPLVRVSGLHKSFETGDGKIEVLRGIDFEIQPGDCVAIVGSSGVGKSTLLHILGTLDHPTSGTVEFRGEDLFVNSSDELARFRSDCLGFIFQFHHLLPEFSALENIVLPQMIAGTTRREARVRAHELLASVGLGERETHRPGKLSGGEQQRVAIARALLNDPELIFMDEPTAGLDPVSSRRIKELIKSQKRAGKTVFLTTHDMTVADELCDRVAFIVDGALACVDSPRSLKLRHGQRSVRVEYGANSAVTSREFPIDGLGENADFLALLREREIETIHTQETSLEGVFIEVTGRGLS